MERIVKQISFSTLSTAKITRVAAYARVSSGKDAMIHSLSAQVSYYCNYIQRHKGWVYIGVYSDEAITGTKDNREGFQKLLADCKDGKIDLVVTKSISRFARNTVTLLETVRDLKAINVDVYFEEQNIHSMSSDGELMLTILASYAQEESLSASENQKWRIRKGFENGELINLRYLYGYDISKGKIEINTAEAEDVRYIFSAFIQGVSFGSIARKMNADGKLCKNGGKWCVTRIRETLSNEKYTGNALLQKQYRNNHLDKKEIPNRGVLPQYYAEDTHDAIIVLDTFNKAQELLKEISLGNSNGKPAQITVFSSMIVCPKCKKNYKRNTCNGSVGWNCRTFLEQGKSVCHGKKIPETTLISVCNEVLGNETFDKDLFKAKVQQIIVPEPNHLIFVLNDGKQIEKEWHDRSRRESWTDEMKQISRDRALDLRRNQQ